MSRVSCFWGTLLLLSAVLAGSVNGVEAQQTSEVTTNAAQPPTNRPPVTKRRIAQGHVVSVDTAGHQVTISSANGNSRAVQLSPDALIFMLRPITQKALPVGERVVSVSVANKAVSVVVLAQGAESPLPLLNGDTRISRVTGTITAAVPDLMVKSDTGETVKIELQRDTLLYIAQPATFANITVGSLVRFYAPVGGAPGVATSVTVGSMHISGGQTNTTPFLVRFFAGFLDTAGYLPSSKSGRAALGNLQFSSDAQLFVAPKRVGKLFLTGGLEIFGTSDTNIPFTSTNNELSLLGLALKLTTVHRVGRLSPEITGGIYYAYLHSNRLQIDTSEVVPSVSLGLEFPASRVITLLLNYRLTSTIHGVDTNGLVFGIRFF